MIQKPNELKIAASSRDTQTDINLEKDEKKPSGKGKDVGKAENQ